MAKKNETTEITDPRTGEVMPAGMMADMMADVKAGLTQEFKADDLIIPRLTILQDLSPQVKERNAEYVPGAKPGLIYNSINGTIQQAVTFVPAKYHTPWIAWKPRPDGGLINNDVDPAVLTEENGFREDGIDRYVGFMAPRSNPSADKVKVEVIKTPEWVGVARGEDGWVMPVAISFASTKAKSARKMNTSIDLTELQNEDGTFFTPPPFYHTFVLMTGLEQAGENEWFGFLVNHQGYIGTDPRMTEKAREIRKSLEDGRATIADIADTEQG